MTTERTTCQTCYHYVRERESDRAPYECGICTERDHRCSTTASRAGCRDYRPQPEPQKETSK